MNKDQVIELINQKSLLVHDYTVSPKDLSVLLCLSEKKVNLYNKYKKTRLSNFAFSQILGRLTIPVHFYKRCSDFVQCNIFNDFNRRRKNDYLFRGIGTEEDHFIRSVLSNRYTLCDDKDLFPYVFEMLEDELSDYSFTFKHDEHISELLCISNKLTALDDGVTYKAGFKIINSEVGISAIVVEPIVMFDGYYLGNTDKYSTTLDKVSISHKGQDVLNKFKNNINSYKNISQVGIAQIIEVAKETINKEEALSICKESSLSLRVQQLLEDEWSDIQSLKKVQVIKDILRSVEHLPIFQQEIVRNKISKSINLFSNWENRLQELTEME